MSLPLEGIRVLDLSRYLPGPFCTQILADFGAEIIKIENPKGGELGRSLSPLIEGESTRFPTVNRNKKSITLDLKQEAGQDIFKQLVLGADIVIDQFRPGFMQEIGLDYDALKAINEGIIYCAITGYGWTGPLKYAAGHDINYLSLAGISGMTGVYGERPAISEVPFADVAGGSLYSLIAILLALVHREKTGEGQLCDVAMLDCSISLLAYTLGEWIGLDRLPEMGNEALTGAYACYNVYESKDGKYVSLGAVEGKFWAQFCRRLDREEYIKQQWDPELQSDMQSDIRAIMLTKRRDEWVEFFADDDICFTPVLSLEEMCHHPQVQARNMISKTPNFKGSGRDLYLTGVPIKMSGTPGVAQPIFPALGQDTSDILQEAGYSEQQIIDFKDQGII